MKLEKILAENMLRFGTKNLSNELRKKLIEQTVTQTVDKSPTAVSNGYIITDEDLALLRLNANDPTVKRINKNINRSSVETDDMKTDQSTMWRQELVTKFGQERYNQFIQSMGRVGTQTEKNVSIWYSELTQESRIQFLTQFNTYISELKKRRQDDEYRVQLFKGKLETETLPPVGAPSIPPVTLYIDLNANNQFVDNESAINASVQQGINQLIADAQALQTSLSGTDARLKVTALNIASSSSRFRNTGNAADLSWADLSRARANNVKTELVNQLVKIGISVPDSVIQLKGGKNGDGTTGPQPGIIDNGKGQMVQAALSTDGKFNNVITDPAQIKAAINTFPKDAPSAPHATKAEYDQYKFLLVECKLEVTYEIKSVVPNKIQSRGYTMEINAYKKPGTIKFPVSARIPKIEIFKSSKLKNKSTPPILDCPNL